MNVSTNQERVDFLTEQYDLNENAAKALILTEMGYSASGIASVLGVTTGTARKYLDRLEDEIGEYVTLSLPKPVRYPTFPGDDVTDEKPYSSDVIDLGPEFSDREKPLNKGPHISELDIIQS